MFSPPLLPSELTYVAFIPDAETCVINRFFDANALLSNDIKQTESRLMAEYDGEDTLHSELQAPPESSPVFPAPLKEGSGDMKVEVSLVRPIEQSQRGRTDTVLKDALNSVTSLFRKTDTMGNDFQMSSDQVPFLTGEVTSQLQESAARICRRVEQERLSDTGSSRKVPVPVMDFTIPMPDWKQSQTPAISLFRSLNTLTLETASRRTRSDASKERKLRWRPLNGSSARVSLSECITVNSVSLRLLLDIPGDTEAEGMRLARLFTRGTLRFLGESVDGNEEIAALSPLEQRRSPFPSPDPSPLIPRTQLAPNIDEPTPKKPKHESKTAGSRGFGLLDEGGSDGVGGLLTSYLQIRAPEKAFPAKSTHFSRPARTASTGSSLGFKSLTQSPWANLTANSQVSSLPMPGPECEPGETASRYIVSAALGTGMIRHLDHLCSAAKLLTKDLSNQEKSTGHSGTQGKGSPFVHEADVPFSSSTGAIVADLAQLRQKSLAEEGKTKLRQKVLTVAAIYDKVIVLVSVPKAKWTSDDTRAYTDFVAFAQMLDSSIETVLIGNKEDCLGKWIVHLMNEYRYEGRKNEHFLVEGEATWEMFFRLGGVNVYAAQVLSGALNAAYGSQGLSRLLAMTPEERIAIFGAIIGTHRPLDNLSRWVSNERI